MNSAGAGPAATLTATTERLPIELSWDEQTAGLELSFTVTITFSEAVTGFTLDDISVNGSYPRGAGRWGFSHLLADRESELPGNLGDDL